MAWSRVEPVSSVALGDHITERLRRMIIVGEIPAGAHLAEPGLAASFDVSRGPVRDALRRLEAEGLVVTRRRKVFAAGLTTADIEELYAIRGAIEGLALRLVCARGGDVDWGAARGAVERMRRAAAEGDHVQFARADLAFHSCLYEMAGSRRLLDIWKQYEPTFATLLQITNAEDIDLNPAFGSHEELLTAVSEGRYQDASSELQEHLLGSQNRMVQAHTRFSAGNGG
jgi:GntR family transcriptional regulator, gluconate operon transcriptional repressor